MNVIDLRDQITAGSYQVPVDQVAEAILRCMRAVAVVNPTALAEELREQIDPQ